MKSYFLRRIAPFFIRVVVFLLGSKNKKKANASDFFFIVGSGRNGSTLLSSVLNNHPSIFVPPEQYVIPFYSARWQLMRFISDKSFFRKLSHELLLPGKTVNWELDKEDYRKLDDINNWTSFYEIVNKIFRHYAFKKGKQNVKMLGEKSPLMIHYWSLFFTEFIGAKYIFLVRDPRDVIFSFSKVSGHKANDLQYAIWKWKDALLQFNRIIESDANYLVIRYEDLVTNPQTVFSEIHEFLDLEFDPTRLKIQKDSNLLGVQELEHHKNLSLPINTGSIGKWRGNFSSNELFKIKSELGEMAAEFGYDLSH